MAIKHSEIKEGPLKERKNMEADAMKANDEVIENTNKRGKEKWQNYCKEGKAKQVYKTEKGR